jgi:hypothetical protein
MPRKGNTIAELDAGKLVRRVMFEKGMNKARLARKLGRSGTSIKGTIYNSSMQCYLLWELSVALNHNFFSDLALQLDAATEGKLEQQQNELELLKAEYQRLKEERDTLRTALNLLAQK